MTTNKPEIVAWCYKHPNTSTVWIVDHPSRCPEGTKEAPLIRLSDYEDLQAECERLKHLLAEIEGRKS